MTKNPNKRNNIGDGFKQSDYILKHKLMKQKSQPQVQN